MLDRAHSKRVIRLAPRSASRWNHDRWRKRAAVISSGISEIVDEDSIHLLAHCSIQHHESGFVVERHRSIVEVHRADGEPLAIDDECLRMQGRGLPFVHSHTGIEERVIPGAPFISFCNLGPSF